MATLYKLSASFPVGASLLALAIVACSGAGGEANSDLGTGQPIDGAKAGAAGTDSDPKPDADSGVDEDGGAKPDDEGVGSRGPTEEPDDEDEGDGAGSQGGAGGNPPSSAEAGADGDGGDPEPGPPSEEFLRGQALVDENGCATCHQANFAGFTVFPNITPDAVTGIGSWTDEQIISAIRDGLDANGESMCPTMQRYALGDDQALDIVAFLRGIPAVSRSIASVCPGHGQ